MIWQAVGSYRAAVESPFVATEDKECALEITERSTTRFAYISLQPAKQGFRRTASGLIDL